MRRTSHLTRPLQIAALTALALSLNGCLFLGSAKPPVHFVGEPVEFEKTAKQYKDAPQWVQSGKFAQSTAFGIGMANNLERGFAVDDARLQALGQIAVSIEQQIQATHSAVRTSDATVGSNAGGSRQQIQAQVENLLQNTRVEDIWVVSEQVWGPARTKVWRWKAYVLVVLDRSLADMLQ